MHKWHQERDAKRGLGRPDMKVQKPSQRPGVKRLRELRAALEALKKEQASLEREIRLLETDE